MNKNVSESITICQDSGSIGIFLHADMGRVPKYSEKSGCA